MINPCFYYKSLGLVTHSKSGSARRPVLIYSWLFCSPPLNWHMQEGVHYCYYVLLTGFLLAGGVILKFCCGLGNC